MAENYTLVHHNGTIYPFDEKGVTIGRGRTNSLILDDLSVSRSHARILVREGQCWLRDENSAGGVFVNGNRVQGQQEIFSEDVIRIGDHNLRFGIVEGKRVTTQPGQKNLVLILGTLGVIAVLGLAMSGLFGGSGGSGEWIYSGDSATGENIEEINNAVVGSISTNEEGITLINDYEGSEVTLGFESDSGESVGIVNASYISDETGITVFAVPENRDYYPSIRSFPRSGFANHSRKQASPSHMSMITMYLAPRYFEQSDYYEESYIQLQHLEDLPSNMQTWEKTKPKRENICQLLRNVSVAHASFVITHAVIEPFSGGIHFGVLLLEHVAVEGVCHIVATSPVEKYTLSVNSDLNLYVLSPDYSSMDYGIVFGQVVSEETFEAIAGATVNADNSQAEELNTTSLSNGWYQLPISEGGHTISAEALGYMPGSISVATHNGIVIHADPILLAPTEQTASLGRGDVKITLRWYTRDDLDLHVIDPDGNELFYSNAHADNGGKLDVDSNAACGNTTSSPVENIFWPSGDAPSGEYQVSVVYYENCVSSGPVEYEMTVHLGGQTNSYTGIVTTEKQAEFITRFSH